MLQYYYKKLNESAALRVAERLIGNEEMSGNAQSLPSKNKKLAIALKYWKTQRLNFPKSPAFVDFVNLLQDILWKIEILKLVDIIARFASKYLPCLKYLF